MVNESKYSECLCFVNNHRLKEEYFSWGPGKRDVYSLHYVISGRGRLILDGVEYNVEAGQSFLVYPYVTATLICDLDDPWEYKAIEIRDLDLFPHFLQTAFRRNNPVTPKIEFDGFAKLFDVVEGGNKTSYLRCRTNARLMLLFSYYMEYFPCDSNEESFYVINAREYIEYNYRNTDCTVAKVAEHVKLDRTYLYRLFKEEVGMSVQEYINRYRIERAGSMLRDKNIAVKDVAFSVGFADQMYFSRVFKKIKGVTPTEFRRTENSR